MKQWVFLFPGQGSQYVGMGREFYEQYSDVRELFDEAARILDVDVADLCFRGPEEVLVETANVQPAITVANLACLTVLKLHEIYPAAAAGHSLGEYSALYAAGVVDLPDLLKLVRWRGAFMQEAAERSPGGMAAIMNLEEDKLEEVCRLCDVEVANLNCPEQIILTGSREPIRQAMAMSSRLGAKKCVELKVSGPWHSRCMQLAKDKFESIVGECAFHAPRIQVVSNIDAKPLEAPEHTAGKLVNQLCGSVLWQQSMEWFLDNGYEHFVEVGPKKVLRGIMRRINRQVEVLNVEDVATLSAFLQANQ